MSFNHLKRLEEYEKALVRALGPVNDDDTTIEFEFIKSYNV